MTAGRAHHRAPDDPAEPVVLSLYVSGASPRSGSAVAMVRELCERHLPGRYSLEVIDVHQQPDLLAADEIVVLPTLVRRAPGPVCELAGDLLNSDRLLPILTADDSSVPARGEDPTAASDEAPLATAGETTAPPHGRPPAVTDHQGREM